MHFRRHYLSASATFAIILAGVVIVLAGYYESPGLLVGQVLAIALPAFAPFAFLGAAKVRSGWVTAVVASMVIGGWARVVWIDTRPCDGGGATMALLVGWAACTLAFLMAAVLAIVWDAQRERRSS
jgi:hypothetical protein